MTEDLSDLMGRQHGLVLRRQAYAAGLAGPQVDRLRRTGQWVAVRPGVYAASSLWESLDEHVGRPRLRVLAASLSMHHPHVLSHDSAALMLGLPVLLERPETVHVTRAGVLGGRSTTGVTHHKAEYRPDQVVVVDGVSVLDAARTAVDVARHLGERHGLVACDSALRGGATREDLEAAIAPMVCWPGVTTARRCVRLADGESDSVGESLLRLVVLGLGIGAVHLQLGLAHRGTEAWADLRVGRHLFEFDGRVKYRSVEDGGVATTSVDQVMWEEKLRQGWLTGFRLGMSRVTWADLMPDQRRSTEIRLRREHAMTQAAYGADISDLAPYVLPPQRRRRRTVCAPHGQL